MAETSRLPDGTDTRDGLVRRLDNVCDVVRRGLDSRGRREVSDVGDGLHDKCSESLKEIS